MHKALYREYRPLRFEDLIGQDFIVKTLKNQLKNNSISHAYIFCGTRGTGKTSTAKILARAINCTGDDKPCNICESCVSILDGSSIDVMEIDAASNNSVDDIRELRETVKYTPNVSKYKVYIIDEVHMLSQGAFNALLKTLEEPPSHAIFILATTEPNKIPATILSRCQRFDFRRVPTGIIIEKMKYICDKEGVDVEDEALSVIARNGNGSVRDSLSLLDKCVSFVDKKLMSRDVLELIGSADYEDLFSFVEAIIDLNTSKAIKMVDNFYMWGKEFKILCEDTINIFRSIMMAQVFEEIETYDFTPEYREKILDLSKRVKIAEIIRILNTLTELMDKMKNALDPKVIFEVYVMKLTVVSIDKKDEAILRRIDKIEKIVENDKMSVRVDEELIKREVEDFIIKNRDRFKIEVSSENKIDNGYKKNPDTDDRVEHDKKYDERIASEEKTVHSKGEYLEKSKINMFDEYAKITDEVTNSMEPPFRAYMSNIIYKKIMDNKLYLVFNDKADFALVNIKEKYEEEFLKRVNERLKSPIDIVFALDKELKDILEDEKNRELSDVEKFLIEKVGPDIEFE